MQIPLSCFVVQIVLAIGLSLGYLLKVNFCFGAVRPEHNMSLEKQKRYFFMSRVLFSTIIFNTFGFDTN